MRGITLTIALAGALAVAGCGRSSSKDSGQNRGVPTSTMKVTIQNGEGGNAALAIQGGYVTSTPAGIDCGGTGHAACSYDFPYGPTPVVLTAHPSPSTNVVLYWAGDCAGLDLTCSLEPTYADRYVVIQMGEWGRRQSHPNWSSGAVHSARYQDYLAGVEGALQCTWCHGQNLQGQGLALACDRCHAMPTKDVNAQAPVMSVATDFSGLTGSLAKLTVSASDPNPLGGAFSCSATLLSQPAGSSLTPTGGAATDCGAAPQVVSFTPMVNGLYVVRVAVTAGDVTVNRDVYLGSASYGGGLVAGTTTSNAMATQLIADLAIAVPTAAGKNALVVYRELANITPATPPTDGSASTQGGVLAWASRPYDVIDVRDAASFAAGHIPGAINVPMQDLPGVLLAMPYFPTGYDSTGAKSVLVAGYTRGDSLLAGNLVAMARFGLGALVGSVFYLQDGMATWTFDKVAAPFRWNDDLGKYRFEWTLADTKYLESGGGTFSLSGKPTYPFPAISDFTGITETGNAAAMKRILVRVREWATWALADAEANGVPHSEAFVSNWGYYKRLRDAEIAASRTPASTFQLFSNQNDAQWNAERAINAYRNFATVSLANVPYINPSVPVLFHCFANTSAVPPCFKMTVLGYRARTILYGITGAIKYDTVGIAAGYNSGFQAGLPDASSGGNDFPLSKVTPDAQDLAWTHPAAAGCRACHADYGALYTLAAKQTSAPTPPVLSEGEG